MPLATVRVKKPLNRLIYINNKYTESAGNSGLISFRVSTGRQTFETLNGDGKIDNRKRIRVEPRDRAIEIELDPVDPPEEARP